MDEEKKPEQLRIGWLREQIRAMEVEAEKLQQKIAAYKQLIVIESTGRRVPSPTSTNARPAVAIKEILKAGPATKEEILDKLKAQLFEFKEEPNKAVEKSLIMCVHAGTIIQNGDKYKLPSE